MDKEYEAYLKEKIKAELYPKLGQELWFDMQVEGVNLRVHAPYRADDDGRLYPDPFDATITVPDDDQDLSPVLDGRVLDLLLGDIPNHE